MRRIEARRRNASPSRFRHSQSFASLLHLSNHAKVRSTTMYCAPFGQDNKAFGGIGKFDDVDADLLQDFPDSGAKQWPLIAAIGVELQ